MDTLVQLNRSPLKITPSSLIIPFKATEKFVSKRLTVCNISDHSVFVRVSPMQTTYFEVFPIFNGVLDSGDKFELLVSCYPSETRHYHDCLAVYCQNHHSFMCRVSAEPILSEIKIPSQIDLGEVSIGATKSYSFRLQSPRDAELLFNFSSSNLGSEFQIHPKKGVIPAGSTVEIHVSYLALTIDLIHTELLLFFPDHCVTPFRISITANAKMSTPFSCHPEEVVSRKKIPVKERSYESRNLSHVISDIETPLESSMQYRLHLENFYHDVEDIRHRHTEHSVKRTNAVVAARTRSKILQICWSQSEVTYGDPWSALRIPHRNYMVGSINELNKLGKVCSEDAQWFVRFEVLKKFMQAVCCIIQANRIKKNLQKLQM